MAGEIAMPAARASIPTLQPAATEPWDEAWAAVARRDKSARGFVYAVTTTGVFCRSGCPSRRPLREHVRFFAAAEAARAAGFRPCLRCRPEEAPAEAVLARRMADFLVQQKDRAVTLAELGRLTGRSPFTAQKIFRRVLGLTPAAYQRQWRAAALREELRESESVTEAVYAAGFGASSRAYDVAGDVLGMRPGAFRRGGQGVVIRYWTAPTLLGEMLVARTERGICAVALGAEREGLQRELRERFEAAELREEPELGAQIEAIAQGCRESPAALLDLPLDLRATAFQMRVWEALRRIPAGETRSYREVAVALGNPKAVRAVARACASNPAALLVPCHRVVGSDGQLTGYRWGVERKRKILEMEAKRRR
jgi:AraC family transcriptional regulator of adaptative response/methylated-DNA-[protein]-cysteine methyltransferase